MRWSTLRAEHHRHVWRNQTDKADGAHGRGHQSAQQRDQDQQH
ncbi:Uncharacterised protein [Vibrio cholerae]|nr:Uncharacterised protein [Vibrio cholerae]